MKKFLFLAFALLMLSARLPAQNSVTGNLNAATTTCLVSNSCIEIDVPQNVGGATLKISGTFSATTQFEVSGDPLTVPLASAVWVAISATPSNSTTTATSATAAGVWQVNITGYRRIRMRVSTYVSGTVVAAINLSSASARGGSGAGAGGTVTGTGASPQVAFWSSPTALSGDGQFTWDSTNHGAFIGPPESSFNSSLLNWFGNTTPLPLEITVLNTAAVGATLGLIGQGDGTALNIIQLGTTSAQNPLAMLVQGASKMASGTNTQTYGVVSSASTLGAGTIGTAASFVSSGPGLNSGSTGNITSLSGYRAEGPELVGSGTITNDYGVYVAKQGGSAQVTNSYSYYSVDVGAGANDYSFYSAGGKNLFAGSVNVGSLLTATNCTSSASPAVCGSAAAGTVVVAAAATTVVVNTTAVTANSEIFVQYDSSLGTKLSVTCNTTAEVPAVTARTAATSFTITIPVGPTTNPACYSYSIVN